MPYVVELDKITSSVLPSGMTTRIIAIDGGGGAGKSTLAKWLSPVLGGAPIVHIDDFIAGPDDLRPHWCQRVIDQFLEPLSKNHPAHYQRFDWEQNQLAEWHEVQPSANVMLEGVSSLRREFRPYLSYGIWIETSPEIRLQRGLERDGQHRLDDWTKWMEWDEAYAADHRSQEYANLVIDGVKN